MWIALCFLIAGLMCRFFVINISLNWGNSMAPTCLDGDIVVVNRLIYWLRSPKENETVMLKDPDGIRRFLHKRVTTAKDDYCMVHGDNALNSRDSRKFGAVAKKDIVGRTEIILFSVDWANKRLRWKRFFKRIK